MKTSCNTHHFLCLAAVLAAVPRVAADEEASTGAVTVQYMGASGGMKLFPNGVESDYIMVQQDKLEEIEPDGKATNNKLNVAGRNTWTPLVANNISDTAVDYTTTFEKKDGYVTFKLITHLTTDDITTYDIVPCSACAAVPSNSTFSPTPEPGGTGTASPTPSPEVVYSAGECQDEDGNCLPLQEDGTCATNFTTCTVGVTTRKDTLKFSVMVSGWEFLSSDNKLAYGLSIKSKSGGSEAQIENSNTTKGEGDSTEEVEGKKVTLDGGFITMPSTDLVSGGQEDKQREVKIVLNAGDKTTIDFEFDSFESGETLYYDPDIGATPPTAAPTPSPTTDVFSAAGFHSPSAMGVLLLATLSAMLIAQ